MKISNGVEMLELDVQVFGSRAVFNPTLVWDEETAILIDCGMPGGLEQIRAAMARAGVPFDKLTAVILTHQDIDHIGGLPEILQASGRRIEVYAHALDQPYIEGRLPLIKLEPGRMEKAMGSLPEEVRQQTLALYENPPKAKVDRTLADGEELPYCGGIRVVYTPGHTPGHISLYLKQSKTLVAGDAMIIWDGVLRGPVRQTTPDMDTAIRSLQKFLDLDVESVICYHGGLWQGNVNERLHAILGLSGS
ncbi:MBL fold metallo-hydrolase [Brevibacillus sp. SYP-B805]|uniref:MBL fold metallo-hydrolase n=1 Tax=Brevibacillus sp. SYP-B805 TaxID=1578199 RepID=UPI0013EB86D1|nr:MBL fold metallo-hydrolase [Brevibacillus sp. SYP-B805]NGQ94375.1 MBL fold metallo-hydrolase [Brevibacillus sp. SYP-B805]